MPRRRAPAGATRPVPAAPEPAPVGSGDDVLALARRRFLDGERISPEQLGRRARHLAGHRLPLGRERRAARRRGDRAARRGHASAAPCARRAGRGAERVLDALARGMRYIASTKPYQAFLARDPQKALRIVASKEGRCRRARSR